MASLKENDEFICGKQHSKREYCHESHRRVSQLGLVQRRIWFEGKFGLQANLLSPAKGALRF
ncbi:MAG TPA: hypothetical protein DDW52_23960 [Planctomycetaceae bacterium]|nr:hypothetical protein [Planctomycetaceae bacterium]